MFFKIFSSSYVLLLPTTIYTVDKDLLPSQTRRTYMHTGLRIFFMLFQYANSLLAAQFDGMRSE